MVNAPSVIRKDYVFRLHRYGRTWPESPAKIKWDATAVGAPAVFGALLAGEGAWFAPGPVTATAPEALANPAWTVRSLDAGGLPMLYDDVGHPLGEGEEFRFPVTGGWIGGVPR